MQTICDEWPVARKPHLCMHCSRAINKGEKYNRQFNVVAGDAWTYKTCRHCRALVSLIDIDPWGEGITDWDIADYEPRTADEEWLLECWRNRWTYPSGRLMPVPSEKENQHV